MITKALTAALLVAAPLFTIHAQTPTTIEYTGRVTVAGQNFTSSVDAPGFFKCILVTGTGDTIWSNDGTAGAPEGSSTNGSEPTGSAGPPPVAAAIELVDGSPTSPFAVNGQFTLRLGAGTTPPITPEVLTDGGGIVRNDVRLRVWFSEDNATFQQLTPDVVFGSVPFALWATNAENVTGREVVGPDQLASEAVTGEKLAVGLAVPVGGVICWWGNVGEIPEGFELCDGGAPVTPESVLTGVKPDLRDKFVKAGGPGDALLAELDSGGAHTIAGRTSGATEAPLPAHNHAFTVNTTTTNNGNHRHSFQTTRGGSQHGGVSNQSTSNNAGGDRTVNTSTNGAHTHAINFNGATAQRGTGGTHTHTIPSHDNRPAFQELFYIIRVK